MKTQEEEAEIKHTNDRRFFAGENVDIWLDKPLGSEGKILLDDTREYSFYLAADPIPDGKIWEVKIYRHTLQYITNHIAMYAPAAAVAVGSKLILKPDED